MNLIEETLQDKEEKKRRKISRIILVAIFLIILIIIGIVAYIVYIQNTVLKLTIDGQPNEELKNILVFEEDGAIYAPIKEIAQYFNYESYNGEYTAKSEEQSKCYVINENEVANLELNQNKIYKLDLTQSDANYEYAYMGKPVIARNGVLYVSAEDLGKVFNVSFEYDKSKNKITILTLPYLYTQYSTKVLDLNYKLDDEFVNQKTILKDQLVVEKDNAYGVVKIDGINQKTGKLQVTEVLEPKYDEITYLVTIEDFLVEADGEVGILSSSGETKVDIAYESIELMDSDTGLYLVQQNDRYGVIDIKGRVKIDIENDEIGFDISDFARNNIKSKYVLADTLIPVKKDKFWALYDVNGKQLTEYKYDSLGYKASNNRDAVNLLVIPNYNVIVACKDKKYTLVNSLGKELFANVADDIYMTINRETNGSETRHYYIAVNDQRMDAEEYMDKNGVSAKSNSNNKNSSSSSNNSSKKTENSNQNENSEKNNEQNNSEENNKEEGNNEENSNEENNNEE